MLKLISAVVYGGEFPKAHDSIDWKLIYDISKLHNVSNIIAYAMVKGNYHIPQ